MKRLLILMALVPMVLVSCDKDPKESPGGVSFTATAPAGSNFTWPADGKTGVFSPEAKASNVALTVGSSGAGTVQLTGSVDGGDKFYAYYPYAASNTIASSVSFNLQIAQTTSTNAASNFFMTASATAASGKDGIVDLGFKHVGAAVKFAVTVPASMAAGETIKSFIATCEEQAFYTTFSVDLTSGLATLPARGALSSAEKLTLACSPETVTAAGATYNAMLYVIPDSYAGKTIEVEVVTADGNYVFKHTFTGDIAAGVTYTVNYTLSIADWYNPDSPRIMAEALEVTSPINAPVKINIANVTAANLNPVKIELIPSEGDKVAYELTAADLSSGIVTVSGGAMDNRPQPGKQYTVNVLDAAGRVLSTTTVTTPALSSDIQIVEAGVDLKDVIENSGRKAKLFLKPGSYTNTSGIITVTSDLTLLADDPSNTVIEFSKTIQPKGSVNTISFSGMTWKSSNSHFIRPIADATNGSFDIESLTIDNCVFDFSAGTANDSYGVLYFPSAYNDGYTGRLGNYTINNTVYFASGKCKERLAATVNLSGPHKYAKFDKLTLTNNTFANLFGGMIILPAGDGVVSQLTRNDNIKPTVTLKNNTLYKIFCDPTFAGAAAMIHTGSSGLSMECALDFKDNIVHFGGTYCQILNCTGDTHTNSIGNMGNNWGLNSQSWLAMSSSTAITWQNKFDGTPAELFSAPGDDPTADGVSFKVAGDGVSGGDPRWNK